jgi:hypothetical protein
MPNAFVAILAAFAGVIELDAEVRTVDTSWKQA